MYCGECGTKNNKDALYCSECGKKLVQKENKQPMSKKKKFILITILIIVIALVIGYNIINSMCSAEKVATSYVEALINNDADKLYDTLNIDKNNKFTSKESFEKIYKEKYQTDVEVSNYTLTNIEYTDNNLKAEVEFKIIYNDSNEDTITIDLVKNSKNKFLIFDNWNISNNDNYLLVDNYTIKVAKNAKVSVNDIELDSSYLNKDESNDDIDVYVIDQIFQGKAEIKTSVWGIETTKEVNISSYNDTYTLDFDINSISEENKTKLEEQIKNDINNLYKNIIDKKTWNDVEKNYIYNEEKLEELKEEYNDLYEKLTDEDRVLKSYNITDTSINDISIDEGKLKIRIRITYNYEIEYTNSRNEVKTTNKTRSSYITVKYGYYDNNFKLNEVNNLVTYFPN